ncbi:uncharacterized protein CYBJADRAFT_168009 [Cyberlindnera jadinii NRRL Y-1542]|uniref:Uncharacterized protein n=1 Tax=Cyberlindnera jadinii (strain ATCC 18201 / CBS 1600 / BCRC 20928 / JCM 3617 / NBRC 0987 / NRRL Y-1542) TaxID=983966 RepID=A0A1E4S0A3_CYBJN|nr:hypothetical protein CYBJADRAFT_168009 [Cyberlindnera jadinii NRRL Y-1542]ODV72926.1 hypothetical protein CYBJADRAFT_168009 [Cyberlindnera jadinii NRRL Y-1542]
MREPGVEPGAPRWQLGILPLNHSRFLLICESSTSLYCQIRQRVELIVVSAVVTTVHWFVDSKAAV